MSSRERVLMDAGCTWLLIPALCSLLNHSQRGTNWPRVHFTCFYSTEYNQCPPVCAAEHTENRGNICSVLSNGAEGFMHFPPRWLPHIYSLVVTHLQQCGFFFILKKKQVKNKRRSARFECAESVLSSPLKTASKPFCHQFVDTSLCCRHVGAIVAVREYWYHNYKQEEHWAGHNYICMMWCEENSSPWMSFHFRHWVLFHHFAFI